MILIRDYRCTIQDQKFWKWLLKVLKQNLFLSIKHQSHMHRQNNHHQQGELLPRQRSLIIIQERINGTLSTLAELNFMYTRPTMMIATKVKKSLEWMAPSKGVATVSKKCFEARKQKLLFFFFFRVSPRRRIASLKRSTKATLSRQL